MTESLEKRHQNSDRYSRDVEDDVHFDVDVVSRNNFLATNRADLDFDVDNTKGLGADVDLYKSGVHGFVELSESRDQTYRTYTPMIQRKDA